MAKLSALQIGDRVRFTRYVHAESVSGTASMMGVGAGTEGTVAEAAAEAIGVKIKGWKNLLRVTDGDAVEKV